MFVLSSEVIEQLDEMFSGNAVNYAFEHGGLAEYASIPRPAVEEFSVLAGYFYNSGPRGALRLAELYRGFAKEATKDLDAAWLKRLSGIWQGIAEGTAARIRGSARALRRTLGVAELRE